MLDFFEEYNFALAGEDEETVLRRARAAIAMDTIAAHMDEIPNCEYISAIGASNHADALSKALELNGASGFRFTAGSFIIDAEKQFTALAAQSHESLAAFVDTYRLDDARAFAPVRPENQADLDAYGLAEEYLRDLAMLRVAFGLPEQVSKVPALPEAITSRERTFGVDGDGFVVPQPKDHE